MKNVTKQPAQGNSCSFCDRCKLSQNRLGLDYPYEYTYRMESDRSLVANICKDCITKLNQFVKFIEL